jgi:hypothetical protein
MRNFEALVIRCTARVYEYVEQLWLDEWSMEQEYVTDKGQRIGDARIESVIAEPLSFPCSPLSWSSFVCCKPR